METDRRQRPRTRGNGTGTAIRRGKTWTAVVIVDWKESEDGTHLVPVRRTRGGFSCRRDALNYCPQLYTEAEQARSARVSLRALYEAWASSYASRVSSSTMDSYKYAYAHFKPLHREYVDSITAADLQRCMDACTAGKRTHENMKCVAGLLWQYAVDAGYVEKDITAGLYIGRHTTTQREPLTEREVAVIRSAIGSVRYAEYVYCLCYLGFRPGEFLSLRKDHFRTYEGIDVLVNGSKTEAGRDRVVIIPPQILDLVRARLFVPGTELLFPQYQFNRSGTALKGFKPMHHAYFRENVFKPMMASLGIAEGKVPYSARHTYSDKLKRAEGDDKTKAGLMGHTDYAFTKSHYQSTDLDDLLAVALTIE